MNKTTSARTVIQTVGRVNTASDPARRIIMCIPNAARSETMDQWNFRTISTGTSEPDHRLTHESTAGTLVICKICIS